MEVKEQTPHINVDFFEDLTGDISKSASKGVEEVGNRIKMLREEKGLSLDELSKMTGFEVGLLSQIENNEIQPQLGTVIKLSKALDSAFSRIVSGVGEKLYSITRKEDQKTISRSSTLTGKKKLYTYKSLAPEVKGRHMETLIVQLEENPDEEISVHDGEEFIYVINGRVKLKIGEDRFELEPGDSAYYLSTTPHVLGSKNGNATILAVLYGG
ncbi:MAG: XRE family transcriptional regulator [Desulfobacteraceae bacterium IS3]|jgi:transcriptional regulator with XRE-family HTH domain|nr:MAG: XRE family transcriptional regulator [Desulfobacteraceae bacterium IS3]